MYFFTKMATLSLHGGETGEKLFDELKSWTT